MSKVHGENFQSIDDGDAYSTIRRQLS